MARPTTLWIAIFVIVPWSGVLPKQPEHIRIAGLFDSEDNEQETAFQLAAARINADTIILPRSTLVPVVEKVERDDSFHATKKVCDLLKKGVAGVFGPQSDVTSVHVRSICDALEVAYVETRWDFQVQRDDRSINLYPRPSVLSRAFVDLVKAWGWTHFALVYEEPEGVIRLQDFWKLAQKNGWKVKMYQFPRGQPYRDLFWKIKESKETKMILDVRRENIYTVLKHAQQVGMMTEQHDYIVTSLDLHTVDLEDFKHGKTNISGFRLVDEEGAEMQEVLHDWARLLARQGRTDVTVPMRMKTESALIYDAVKLFAQSVQDLETGTTLKFPSITCDSGKRGEHGTSLINYIKTLSTKGLTKQVSFDPQGFRSEFYLDLMYLTKKSLEKVGTWDITGGVNISHNASIGHDKPMRNETLRVTTTLTPPYTRLKESAIKLTGNDRFEGYAIDLIKELASILGFSYQFQLVKDEKYGQEISNITKEWNGMIGEVMRGEADIAIVDLSITSKRQSVVDFTMPFMHTGISILFKRPTEKSMSLFSFLSPFSTEVWAYMICAYVGVSITLFIVGRLSPYEWDNPHPCRQNDQILENNFSLLNSLWFTIGSVMQQGSDLEPRAMSTRTIAGIWYFFTLIMISSYTANLAAFLTVEQTIYPFDNAESLSKQTTIQYGCLETGSTRNFFQDSSIPHYQRIWENMQQFQPKSLVANVEEALKRVQEGNYAYFTEAAFIEYKTERDCNLTRIGSQLDTKNYGIATRKGSKYGPLLTSAILKLQENGVLHQLRERWWRQKGGGKCADESKKSSSSVTELGLGNVGGVFVVLMGGLCLAIIVAILEFCWTAKKQKAAGEKESLCKSMVKELAFAMSCHSSTKPAPRNSSEDKSSDFRVATIPGFNTEY